MTPLSYLSAIRVTGNDAGKFLQSQLTAHLAGLTSPASTFSGICNPKGQVIATTLVAPQEDHWLLVLESSLVEKVITKLQPFVLRDDVRLEAASDLYLFVVDPSDFLVGRITMLEPRTLPLQYAISIMQPPPNPEAESRWRRKELLSGLAWLNATSSEKYIPQMLGLDMIGAVSFSKGCYPGQEVIARARHLGEVKRKPQVLDIKGPRKPLLDQPVSIRTSGGQVEASVVDCVSTSATDHTVLAVAAMQPGDAVSAMQQAGTYWSAKRAFRDFPH